MARSSFYAMTFSPARRAAAGKASGTEARDLGPIEADLEASPWEGEGSASGLSRHPGCAPPDAREQSALPTCCANGGNPHDGEIITHAPNLRRHRWRSGVHGWGWIFTAVEHWNAECAGWHVCKRGDRFAALQPISMGRRAVWLDRGRRGSGAGLRMDHGSRYLSDHFTNQIKFWGIQPSYAFVAEPQTNGVAERFNRTLKEQIIHGRIYRNIAELRDAVRDFVELYNAQWSVEKNAT